jgi:hypothetical protein
VASQSSLEAMGRITGHIQELRMGNRNNWLDEMQDTLIHVRSAIGCKVAGLLFSSAKPCWGFSYWLTFDAINNRVFYSSRSAASGPRHYRPAPHVGGDRPQSLPRGGQGLYPDDRFVLPSRNFPKRSGRLTERATRFNDLVNFRARTLMDGRSPPRQIHQLIPDLFGVRRVRRKA